MKILVLSFYFRPDLSACSFRSTALVNALCKTMPVGSHIDVVTTAPNRYHSFEAAAPRQEHDANVSITRISLPPHRSGFADQSRAFLAFARGALRATKDGDYDIVFATSSRLMTAVLGAWIARQRGALLYLDIRDIFVDTIQDVLPRNVSWAARRIFSALERWAVTRANKVNLVSLGFEGYFTARYPRQRFSFYTNGIDEEFMAAAASATTQAAEDSVRSLNVVYAGNLGEGQGLHMILPQLAIAMGARVRFKVIGDGSRRHALEAALSASGATNVELLGPIVRSELLRTYREADVLFLHLNEHEAFKKVLPSKLFEYAALGKPVWAGVAGYAAEFVTSEINNAAVFPPCDVDRAVESFAKLVIEDAPRTTFVAKYARANISRAMAMEILAVAGGR